MLLSFYLLTEHCVLLLLRLLYFMLFCSLRFVYIDSDGNEVLHKDTAAVTVDGILFIYKLLCVIF